MSPTVTVMNDGEHARRGHDGGNVQAVVPCSRCWMYYGVEVESVQGRISRRLRFYNLYLAQHFEVRCLVLDEDPFRTFEMKVRDGTRKYACVTSPMLCVRIRLARCAGVRGMFPHSIDTTNRLFRGSAPSRSWLKKTSQVLFWSFAGGHMNKLPRIMSQC